MKKLSNQTIKKATLPSHKTQSKISDGGGLYLLITQTSKSFKYDYRFSGKRKTLSIGIYPTTTLEHARMIHQQAKVDIAHGIDPSQKKQAQQQASKTRAANTFRDLATRMLKQQQETLKPASYQSKKSSINRYLTPILNKPIADITTPEIMGLLEEIEETGKTVTAKKIKGLIGEVMRYAMRKGIIISDPTQALAGALKRTTTKHRPHLDSHADIAKLMYGIHYHYQGNTTIHLALQLSPLLMLRPIEIRMMQWQWVNLDAAEIRFPADFMKMNNKHIVPLSKQAISILRAAKSNNPYSDNYVFPAITTHKKPMAANAINTALRQLGWNTQTQICAHGFRATAATILDEHMEYNNDAIELQLSHQESNKVKSAYRHAKHLKTRKAMMQAWSDFLYRPLTTINIKQAA